jgi:hypothetical protein
MQAVRDGSSKTMVLSEVLGWQDSSDGRGAWLWNGMGGASFTAKTLPNAEPTSDTDPNDPNFDFVVFCGAITEAQRQDFLCKTASSEEWSTYAAARSKHVGGVVTVFADNHTQFIADTIELDVWRSFATRQGPDFLTASPPWVEPDAQPGADY